MHGGVIAEAFEGAMRKVNHTHIHLGPGRVGLCAAAVLKALGEGAVRSLQARLGPDIHKRP